MIFRFALYPDALTSYLWKYFALICTQSIQNFSRFDWIFSRFFNKAAVCPLLSGWFPYRGDSLNKNTNLLTVVNFVFKSLKKDFLLQEICFIFHLKRTAWMHAALQPFCKQMVAFLQQLRKVCIMLRICYNWRTLHKLHLHFVLSFASASKVSFWKKSAMKKS